MQVPGGWPAVAAVSGVAVVLSLAGCSAAHSLRADAHHHITTASTNPPIAPSATPVSTPTPVATKKPAVHKAPVKAPVHHVAPPPKKPKPPHPPPPPVSYKDGGYGSNGSYISPGGNEVLHVQLTLASGVITSLSVTSVMVDPTAAGYEANFEAGINAIVVGHNIATLSVGAVGGSSLTVRGFDAAIANIKAQARS